MGYECSNRAEGRFAEFPGKFCSAATGRRRPETYQFTPACPEQLGNSSPEAYAAEGDEPGTMFRACFSILLARKDPFKVVPKCKDHHAH